MFRFKQFSVNDDRCAMKVGTDGVLLGAWAQIPESARVLEVGTGCGLVALMLAQRFPEISLTAIEIDADAAGQARENVVLTPFSPRVNVVCGDFLTYEESGFHAIVSNPPFFEEDLLPPDSMRAKARHTDAGLNFDALVARSCLLLAEGGSFLVIIPKVSQTRFHAICNHYGLRLVRATDVRTVLRKSPKRVLLHFVKEQQCSNDALERGASMHHEVLRDEIILMEDGNRTEAYSRLCQDFYL